MRETCAILVPDPGHLRTFHAYVRGQELTISPAKVSAALGLPAVPDHVYPTQQGQTFPSYDTIATEFSGGWIKKWATKGKKNFPIKHLTREYHFLHPTVYNCILLTAFKSELAPWYS